MYKLSHILLFSIAIIFLTLSLSINFFPNVDLLPALSHMFERAYENMCDRAGRRSTFGKKLMDNDNVRNIIAILNNKICDSLYIKTVNTMFVNTSTK
jgi:hypothetical protein